MPDNKKLPAHDDFVSKVVKDPKQPPDALLLTGFVGKSSEEGYTRIHFDPELRSYVDVPDDAILHSEKIPPEHSSLGGSHVWIKRDAEVIHGAVGPQRTKAKFFEGPIAGGAPPLPPTHLPALCPPTPLANCPTSLVGCPPPSQLIVQCPTHAIACPSPVIHSPPSPVPQCPILTAAVNCPSHAVHCPPPTPLCPVTPVHPCPTPPHICPVTPVHVCPTPTCPVTPFHPCPTPPHICPVTPVHPCPTPACPVTPFHPCPTPPHICPLTPAHPCPSHEKPHRLFPWRCRHCVVTA